MLELLKESWGKTDFALVVQAVVFTSIHVPALAHFGEASQALSGMASVLMMGLILGWLRERTGNLWMPSSAHLAFNTIYIISYTIGL